jgi:membrane protease YdiL (CAAX protease family)
VTASTSLKEPPSYLRFLPRFLFTQDRPAASFILKAWLVALLPSLALSSLVGFLASPTAKTPDIPVDGSTSFLLLTIVGPLLETLILAPMVFGLRRVIGPGPAAIVSALIWAGAHSLVAPIWGLIVWWPFLIFGIVLMTWRDRGFVAAIAVVTAIHGLQNATAGVLLLLTRGF